MANILDKRDEVGDWDKWRWSRVRYGVREREGIYVSDGDRKREEDLRHREKEKGREEGEKEERMC